MTEDVPLLLKLDNVKDVQEVLSVVFKSPPADLREFIKWIAEVRRQEDGSLVLSEEERGRLAVKVCHVFFLFRLLFVFVFLSFFNVVNTQTSAFLDILFCFCFILFELDA